MAGENDTSLEGAAVTGAAEEMQKSCRAGRNMTWGFTLKPAVRKAGQIDRKPDGVQVPRLPGQSSCTQKAIPTAWALVLRDKGGTVKIRK